MASLKQTNTRTQMKKLAITFVVMLFLIILHIVTR
jgi:hypothetical protein